MNPIEHPSVSRLICPAMRLKTAKENSCKKTDDGYFIIDNSNYFSYFKDDDSSHSSHQIYPLIWSNNKESKKFRCGTCECESIDTTYFYFCNDCKKNYHKECVESPHLIKSIYHPKHNLQLLSGNVYCKIRRCYYCGNNNISPLFYHCSLCDFSIDLVCARKPSNMLTYTKRHEHTLNYFPRKNTLICDVCGLVHNTCMYVCLQCDFVVHKTCIYLPFVIRISRHEHRISFTYSSPSRNLSCGVCRQSVDENCGKYSCMKDCTYVVHSKCATREDLWDGKELEDKPEEVFEYLKSFEEISDGVIQHFSHPHHMRFEKGTNMPYDEKEKCQACVLPLYEGDVYKCTDSKCDFILHEECANLPRTKRHMAYPYPLALQISDTAHYFQCRLCQRISCGFKYVSSEPGVDVVTLDVRCAAIFEPFKHQCHRHLLYLTARTSETCSMCRTYGPQRLNCLECDFVLCFGCAALPYIVRYEHDEHLLTLSYEEEAYLNWCEVCEEPIKSPNWLYTCHECGVTLHIDCFRPQDGDYMKPSPKSMLFYEEINIVPNYGLTRPICYSCGTHCRHKIRFETYGRRVFCSGLELISYSQSRDNIND